MPLNRRFTSMDTPQLPTVQPGHQEVRNFKQHGVVHMTLWEGVTVLVRLAITKHMQGIPCKTAIYATTVASLPHVRCPHKLKRAHRDRWLPSSPSVADTSREIKHNTDLEVHG